MRTRLIFSTRGWYVFIHALIFYIPVNSSGDYIGDTASQVFKRLKTVIDSSTKLQLLIELYHDDLYPAAQSNGENFWQNEAIVSSPVPRPQGACNLLRSQLRSRQRWERFSPNLIALLPRPNRERGTYELKNGYFGYDIVVDGTHKIVFKDLHNPTLREENRMIELAYPIITFTFDLSQDLLVTLHRPHNQGFVLNLHCTTPPICFLNQPN